MIRDDSEKNDKRSDLNKKLQKACSILEDYSIDVAYLFGSQLRPERSHKHSDVDLALLFNEADASNDRSILIGTLTDRLYSVFGRNQVDLIDLDQSPLALQFEVVRSHRILFSHNEARRIQFETNVARRYHDQKPYFDRHLNELTQSIGEST